MTKLLEDELRTYQRHREQLLAAAEGKFVLIKDDRVVGTFDSEMDAIRQGYAVFGNVPFLVKEIVEIEVPKKIFSPLLRV